MRLKLTASEATAIAAIESELAVIRLDEQSAVTTVLPAIREVLATDSMLVVTPVEHGDGLAIERFHSDRFADPKELERRWGQFLRTAPRRYAWYDAVRPEPEQRNRVLEAHDLMGPGELEVSAVYQQVLLPLGLHRHRQPRVLLCDGPSLLAWFGSFQDGPVTPRQKLLLGRLAPAMRSRLVVERRLGQAQRRSAALDACLERLGAPAFVIEESGAILEANEAGRALVDLRRNEVRTALVDRLHGRPASLDLELTPIDEAGAARSWLAILAPHSTDARIGKSVARAVNRWGLTKRQREVLEAVVHGQPTTTIAACLEISERAVELHVTAIFDRVGVDSRAALVAAVLLAD